MHNKIFDPPRKEQTHPQYKLLLTTQYNINIPYNWPAFLAMNNGYRSLYVLIKIPY